MSRSLPPGITRTAFGTYRAQVKRQGVRITQTHKTLKEARAWLDAQRAALDAGSWIDPRRGNVTVGQLIDLWLDQRDVAGSTKAVDRAIWASRVEPTWGDVAVDQITTPRIRAWIAKMDGAPATREKSLRVLRGILRMAVEEGRIARNPAEGVAVGGLGARRSGRALDAAQIAALVAALRAPHSDIAAVLAVTGLRWSELAALDVRDVDVAGERVLLRVRKRWVKEENGKRVLKEGTKRGVKHERAVPVVGEAAEIVRRRAQGRLPTQPLFVSPRGGRLDSRNWRRESGWTDATVSLHLDGLRPHDLRHTAATLLLRASGDIKAVQSWLGHATAAITLDTYGHVMTDSVNRAADALGAALGTASEPSAEHDDGNRSGAEGGSPAEDPY